MSLSRTEQGSLATWGRLWDQGRVPLNSGRPSGARAPVAWGVFWGVLWGGLQAASPLAFFWLDDATVYALGLTLIAAVYIGFSVSDGRPKIIVVETAVATGGTSACSTACSATPRRAARSGCTRRWRSPSPGRCVPG